MEVTSQNLFKATATSNCNNKSRIVGEKVIFSQSDLVNLFPIDTKKLASQCELTSNSNSCYYGDVLCATPIKKRLTVSNSMKDVIGRWSKHHHCTDQEKNLKSSDWTNEDMVDFSFPSILCAKDERPMSPIFKGFKFSSSDDGDSSVSMQSTTNTLISDDELYCIPDLEDTQSIEASSPFGIALSPSACFLPLTPHTPRVNLALQEVHSPSPSYRAGSRSQLLAEDFDGAFWEDFMCASTSCTSRHFDRTKSAPWPLVETEMNRLY
jgi:hypothetical protein